VLDVAALERELRAAVAADERQARENEAKLRALRQRVPSYEEFRSAGTPGAGFGGSPALGGASPAPTLGGTPRRGWLPSSNPAP